MLDNKQCRTLISEREEKMTWVLLSPSIVLRVFRPSTGWWKPGEPELERQTGRRRSRYLEFTGQSKRKEKIAERESELWRSAEGPPSLSRLLSVYQNMQVKKLSEAKERLTWKKQAEKVSRAQMDQELLVFSPGWVENIIRGVLSKLFRSVSAHLRGKT